MKKIITQVVPTGNTATESEMSQAQLKRETVTKNV